MANKEQLAILKQGVAAWNKWREENPDAKINLRGAKLDGLDLSGVNFYKAKIKGVKFNNCNLENAHFKESDIGDTFINICIENIIITLTGMILITFYKSLFHIVEMHLDLGLFYTVIVFIMLLFFIVISFFIISLQERYKSKSGFFNKSNLSNSIFDNSKINNIYFSNSYLINVSFIGAKIINSHFDKSDLSWVSFDDAKIHDVYFKNSILTNASFRKAILPNMWYGTDIIINNHHVRKLLTTGIGQNLSLKGKNLTGAYL